MNNSFKTLIDETKSILILLPQTPTFDEVASGLALYLALRGEKEVNIVCTSPMIVSFNRLVGVNKISTEAGNKNLVIKFSGYQAKNIEKVSYDIIAGEFQLTVVPKQGQVSPRQDQVDIKYSGVSAETVILIGGSEEQQFALPDPADLGNAKIIHLGTIAIRGQREIISFDRPASSISEIVASLIKETGLALDPDIATNLLMGIEEGSEGLASPEVNADTFTAMSDLMRAGGRRIAKREALDPRSFPQGSIPGGNVQFENEPEAGESMKEDIDEGDAPNSWFEPKIYKGTSVS